MRLMTLHLRKFRHALATVLFSIGLYQPGIASEPQSITSAEMGLPLLPLR